MLKHLSITLVSSALTGLFCVPATASGEQPTRAQLLAHPEVSGALAIIDAYVQGVQRHDRVPGVSVGIVYDQDLIWQNGYGAANLETRRPANADTLYSICSISKLFTAIGIMQLRDAGKLALRDLVDRHLDWFNIERAAISPTPDRQHHRRAGCRRFSGRF